MGVRDEIGFPTIHQRYADRFFPGTSVLHTRARYTIFVPWLFEDLAGLTGPAAVRALRERERELAGRLKDAGESQVIGGRVFPKPSSQPPSTVYWNALAVWGILRPRLDGRTISRAQAHRLLSAGAAPDYPIGDPEPGPHPAASAADVIPADDEAEEVGRGRHAKLPFLRSGRKRTLWLGSANATLRAWTGRNAEVTAELLVTESVEKGLKALLGSARLVEAPSVEHSPDAAALEEEALERARAQVAVRWAAELSIDDEGIRLTHRSDLHPGGPHSDESDMVLDVSAADAEAKLTRLYEAIENGLAELDDPNLKSRVAELRRIRDAARADAERAEARDEKGAEITSEALTRFTRLAKAGLRRDDGTFRRSHVQKLVQRAEMGSDQIVIRGSTLQLLQTLAASGGKHGVETAGIGVRSFV